jgi:hypothetical protein
MILNFQPEVLELSRVCERLIGYAHQNNGTLSDEECSMIVFYIKELEKEIMPYCSKHHQDACAESPECGAT